jgi:hypothetical protein
MNSGYKVFAKTKYINFIIVLSARNSLRKAVAVNAGLYEDHDVFNFFVHLIAELLIQKKEL